eukprot:jgi/Botrbrau1/14063/Bobra.182_3s0010.1
MCSTPPPPPKGDRSTREGTGTHRMDLPRHLNFVQICTGVCGVSTAPCNDSPQREGTEICSALSGTKRMPQVATCLGDIEQQIPLKRMCIHVQVRREKRKDC